MEKTLVSTNQTKNLAKSSLLIALGFILHSITPPMVFGIKPDFLLACMFIAIIATPKLNNVISVGICSGIISALTTGFPGGQIPSVIEKFITAILFYIIISAITKNTYNSLKISALGFLGTVISGVLFLGSCFFIVGLPAGFTTLLISIVLPTAIANTFVTLLLYKAYSFTDRYIH